MKWLGNEVKEKRGNAIIFLAISITVLIGMAALVTDIGLMTFNKSKLQNAVDAAALAGAQEIPESTTAGSSVAEDYLENNDEEVGTLVSHNISFSESNKKITVEATYEVDFMFAKVIGIDSSNVTVKAAAINAPVSKLGEGLRPFGVLAEDVDDTGEEVTLQIENPGGGKEDEEEEIGPGNTRLVALEYGSKDTGSATRDTVHYGTTGMYEIGDTIFTEPGVTGGNIKSGLEDMFDEYENEDGEVVIYVPIVSTLGIEGRSDPTEIVGFAAFMLTRDDNLPYKKKVIGTFVDKYMAVGVADPDATDYGVRAVNLVE